MEKTIFLVGYMCSGKTTLGRELALQLGVDFYDLDEMIEERAQMRATEIFAQLGEPRFREMEREALRMVAGAPAVVACGGGTPCYGDNMALMNEAGITMWLTTSPERITARLLLPEQKVKRPKFANLPDEAFLPLVKRELEARTPYYSQARLQFDSTDIETGPATERTARRLAILLHPHLETGNEEPKTRN